jgi:sulfate adenylyltransferase
MRPTIDLSYRQYLELEKIAFGAFAPLTGFMTETDFHSVVETMRLPDGKPFPLPVLLDIDRAQATRFPSDIVALRYRGEEVGEIAITSRFTCDRSAVAAKVFGTSDVNHPGVAQLMQMGDLFVGGPVRMSRRSSQCVVRGELTPVETRAWFAMKGWNTVAGFQTRNIPHRAHEHLLRLALEVVDGLFVQPLVGWKKAGDCSPAAILTAYHTLIDGFLPSERVLLGVLSTSMRYAGPREAVFHAIVRRNYGCTHFIVGRDHAGVGGYYGRYDAQALAKRLEPDLGIAILPFAGPYRCSRCGGMVTERSCPHRTTHPDAITEISGTAVRDALRNGARRADDWIRPEVLDSLQAMPVLIGENEP